MQLICSADNLSYIFLCVFVYVCMLNHILPADHMYSATQPSSKISAIDVPDTEPNAILATPLQRCLDICRIAVEHWVTLVYIPCCFVISF